MTSKPAPTDPEALLIERKELAATLREAGVGAQSDRFASLARPSVRLVGGGSAGVSKLGGRPDLPSGMDWPVRPAMPAQKTHQYLTEDERAFLVRPAPLSFIAQVDLGFIARHVAALPGLPDRGVLYFFYDVLHEGWGFDPKDRDGFRVMWTEDGADLEEAPLPDLQLREFSSISLGAVYALDPLDVETRAFAEADTTDTAAGDAYLDWRNEIYWGDHKLGGWPDVVQGEMESECALVSNGIYCGGGSGYNRPEARAILTDEKDWHLLLMIASDDAADMIWGDVGDLFVWIRDRDLKVRDFEKAWVVLQCS